MLAEMYDRLTDVVQARPHTDVVVSIDGVADETYQAVADALDRS